MKFQTKRKVGLVNGKEEFATVYENYDVDKLREAMRHIIEHANQALEEMGKVIPSSTEVCICYEGIQDSVDDFERSFFGRNRGSM